LSCAITAVTSAFLVQRTVDQLLRSDAERTAELWARQFIKRIPNLEAIAGGDALTAADAETVDVFQNVGTVFLFKVFDRDGILRRVSDKIHTFEVGRESIAVHNPAASSVIASGKPFTAIQDGAGKPNRPLHYSEAYVPVIKDGRIIAVVEAYVDQDRQFADYHARALKASATIALLAALAFGIPAVAFYVRSQQVTVADRHIHFLAQHDTLTGLPNRATFQTEIDGRLLGAKPDVRTALLYLDLDGFKAVNDALGHATGDALLTQVATRIRQQLGDGDVAARLGGDEFAVVSSRDGGKACEPLAAGLIEALSQPFTVDGHQVQIGTCVGIAIAPDDATDPQLLLKAADVALYRAKTEGRGAYRFYEIGMDRLLQQRREMEVALRQAVASDQFEVHYQPLLDLSSNEIVGYEALVRWRHPEKGLIPPADFIPLAEETGMIRQIGAWVLNQACADAMRWPERMHVAVNLSAVQFHSRALLLDVAHALGLSGLKPDRLELELTESVLLRETKSALEILSELKGMGVRISMDDFGTGYSSLSYLQMFPFDKIKIDRSFVSGLGLKGEASAIVRAVIGLGKSLGMKTTAEGVETTQQLELLRLEGCTEIQGFLISKPRRASELGYVLDQDVPPNTRSVA
jgi:diguanylate cyclase (GGDEF)-like protein